MWVVPSVSSLTLDRPGQFEQDPPTSGCPETGRRFHGQETECEREREREREGGREKRERESVRRERENEGERE